MNLSFSKILGPRTRLVALMLATITPSARGGDICVAERLAAASGWHLNWVVQLPFDTYRTRLESLSISDSLVVATTGDGRVHAYHEGSAPLAGTLSWSQRIGHATDPGLPADIGPSLVLATRGGNVYGFDRASGDRLWADRLGRMPIAPAVEGDNWVYVPYGPLRILRITAYPTGRPLSMIRAASQTTDDAAAIEAAKLGRSRAALEEVQPLLIEAGTSRAKAIHRLAPFSVGWIGEDGMLVTLNDLDNGWRRHELRLGSQASGDLVHRDGAIWMALSSGDLIRVDSDPSAGLTVGWRVALPKLPSGALMIDGDTLLVSLGTWGIEARSATTGDLLWSRDQPAQLLAAGGGTAWCFDPVGRLVLIDLADGRSLATLQPGRFQMPITNTVTDRLYLATHNGVVASLAPTAITAEEVPAPQQPEPAAVVDNIDPQPDDDDPFKAPADQDDPFATPPSEMDAPRSEDPSSEPASDDPFGPASSEDDPFTSLPRSHRSPA